MYRGGVYRFDQSDSSNAGGGHTHLDLQQQQMQQVAQNILMV